MDVVEVSRRLNVARSAPDIRKLRRIGSTGLPAAQVCDWMSLTLWQDMETGEVWALAWGGFADVDLWLGPGRV